MGFVTLETFYTANIFYGFIVFMTWCKSLSTEKCCFDTLVVKKKLYGPFLWMGFSCLKARATSRRQFTFYHSVPRRPWCSFYRPREDERLRRPWSHPADLNTGTLDWESRALTTRPLLLYIHFIYSTSKRTGRKAINELIK